MSAADKGGTSCRRTGWASGVGEYCTSACDGFAGHDAGVKGEEMGEEKSEEKSEEEAGLAAVQYSARLLSFAGFSSAEALRWNALASSVVHAMHYALIDWERWNEFQVSRGLIDSGDAGLTGMSGRP